jgi:monoamine oxidase
MTSCDILILGAGAAGLACARRLGSKYRISVVEARDRIGGRMFTHRMHDYALPIDLGAEFIHGRPPETFDLLPEAGVIAYDQTFHHAEATPGKPASNDKVWFKVEELLDKMKCPSSGDCSFKDFIERQKNLRPDVKRRAISYIESFNAARYERISVKSLLASAEEEEKLGETQHRIVGGHDQLAQVLARGVHVELNTVVKHIRWSKFKADVTADTLAGEKTYRAERVVIALPLGVLQSDSIRFEPELPVRELIRDKLCMGHVIKATLRCRTPFWEKTDRKLSFVHDLDAPIPVWWTMHPLHTTLLTGWVGGSKAEALDKNRIRESAIDSLQAIFHLTRDQVADQILAVHTHDWSNDPFSRGAYSYAAVGGAKAPQHLSRPILGTLFFAGEHTHTGLMGTVAGAIQSGYRAAEQILDI